jgi:hypothetical protein
MAISALTREIRLGKGVGESERNTVPLAQGQLGGPTAAAETAALSSEIVVLMPKIAGMLA